MKLRILVILIFVGIVEGGPKIDSDNYQDLDNGLLHHEEHNPQTVNHEHHVAATHINSELNEDNLLQQAATDSAESSSSEENTGTGKLDDQDNLDLTTHEEEELSTNEDDQHEQEKHKSHWWSRHKKESDSLNEKQKSNVQLATQKMTSKVNGILRQQVLKKASKYAGEEVDDSDENPLAKKVAVLARDATIRKLSKSMMRKTLHKGVDFVHSKVGSLDNKDGSLTTRDVDLFNERLFARELGFRMANKLADVVSMMAGGALAEKAIHKLHKDPIEEVVEDLGEENVVNLAEELDEENTGDKHGTTTRSLFHHKKEKNHDKDKNKKSKKQNKNKHHGHEAEDENEVEHNEEDHDEKEEDEDHKKIKHKFFGWHNKHDNKQKHEKNGKHKNKEEHEKKGKSDKKKNHEKHHYFSLLKKHKDSGYENEENVE